MAASLFADGENLNENARRSRAKSVKNRKV